MTIHLAPGLGHADGYEECVEAAHAAEAEEEAWCAEVGEDEAGGLHRHEDHHEVGGDGGSLHHRLQLGAEPLRWQSAQYSMLFSQYSEKTSTRVRVL